MSEESKTENTQQLQKEKLKQKYNNRGFQQLTLAEYRTLQNKKTKKFNIPTHIKIIIATPFLLIFCVGIFFVPYSLYLIAIGKPPPEINPPDIRFDQIFRKAEPDIGEKNKSPLQQKE